MNTVRIMLKQSVIQHTDIKLSNGVPGLGQKSSGAYAHKEILWCNKRELYEQNIEKRKNYTVHNHSCPNIVALR